MKKFIKIAGISIAGIFILLVIIGITAGLSQNTKPEKATKIQTEQIAASSSPEKIAQYQPNSTASPKSTIVPALTPVPEPATAAKTSGVVGCKIINYLPDLNCTPGETDPRVTQGNINSTICLSGYTATVRPSTSVTNKIKIERMQAYGDTDSPSNYELDHFIPLELGGSPASILNLFPEPYVNPYGAREKDKVENYLHKQVCDGSLTLQTAQEKIRNNWIEVYNSCCASTNQTVQNIPNNVQQSGHTFYLSSYKTAKYYYCDTDGGWKSLTPKYLKSYSSEQALLKDYPSRALHEACK